MVDVAAPPPRDCDAAVLPDLAPYVRAAETAAAAREADAGEARVEVLREVWPARYVIVCLISSLTIKTL